VRAAPRVLADVVELTFSETHLGKWHIARRTSLDLREKVDATFRIRGLAI
jgi:hypothetical protein